MKKTFEMALLLFICRICVQNKIFIQLRWGE